MEEWLDNPNSKGNKPKDIFADKMSDNYLSNKLEQEYREKGKNAQKEFDKHIKEGEKHSIETGKQSQKEEALRIGGKITRSFIMSLFASLIKDIIRKLISWLIVSKRKISDLISSIKNSIISFFKNIKDHVVNAGKSILTTIIYSILGSIVRTFQKAWMFIKIGYNSVKQTIQYFNDPNNKNKPFSEKMLHVGKIVVTGFTAGGAILLSEVIEKKLMTIPGFAFEIPFLGSLASLIGIFLGGLVSGVIGAIILNYIDRFIAKKQKRLNIIQQNTAKNHILTTQKKIIQVAQKKVQKTANNVACNIVNRHNEAREKIDKMRQQIRNSSNQILD